MHPTKVFISYSYDSDEHITGVERLAQRLEHDGFEVHRDRVNLEDTTLGLAWWMTSEIERADFVLVVCSEGYFQKVRDAQYKNTVRVPLTGVAYEYRFILERLRQRIGPVLPVVLDKSAFSFIPYGLKPEYWYVPDDTGYRALVRRLSNSISPSFLSPTVNIHNIALRNNLPNTDGLVMGRDSQFEDLDMAWASNKVNVICYSTFGGAGKTALVNEWWRRTANTTSFAFGWSFHSQGFEKAQDTSGQFIESALKELGDPEPSSGTEEERAYRLAKKLLSERALLVLDGVEPLQRWPNGQIRDKGLSRLLVTLADNKWSQGLCVITSRAPFPDLDGWAGRTVSMPTLPPLDLEDGAHILESLGVLGHWAELKRAVADVRGHCLSLRLLAAFIVRYCGGDIRLRKDTIQLVPLSEQSPETEHAQRILRAYAKRLARSPERALLCSLGMFDRAADVPALQKLIEAKLPGISKSLPPWGTGEFASIVERLRQQGLIIPENFENPLTLDAHPIVREFFGSLAKRQDPSSWRHANRILFDYFRHKTKQWPETIDEMEPLYAAVLHGCRADLISESLNCVYQQRIQRIDATPEDRFYNNYKLGALGEDAAVLSNFFVTPWYEPSPKLSNSEKALVLRQAGFTLSRLGRDAALPTLQAAIAISKRQLQLTEASMSASHLTTWLIRKGRLGEAIESAKEAIYLADLGDLTRRGREPIVARTNHAMVLHYQGHYNEALTLFLESRRMVEERFGPHPSLLQFGGYLYADLLLDLGKPEAVLQLFAPYINDLSMAINIDQGVIRIAYGRALLQIHRPNTGLLDISNKSNNFSNELPSENVIYQAALLIEKGLLHISGAKREDYLPAAWLAMGELSFALGHTTDAERSLQQAYEYAGWSDMLTYKCDTSLALARVAIESGKVDEALEWLILSESIISRIGYGRRVEYAQWLHTQL